MIIIAPYNDYNFYSRKFENKNDDNSNHINLSGGDQYLEDILNLTVTISSFNQEMAFS